MAITRPLQEKMMMNDPKQQLTLDRPTNYNIIVPGHLDSSWADSESEMSVLTGFTEDGQPITHLTGLFDQAALIGLLRRLYSLGLPLISVQCLDIG
jgi:hypothetical protein